MRQVVVILSSAIIFAVWTVTASQVTLWGLGTLELVGCPTWQWWSYLLATMPDAGTQDLVNQWLFVGGVAGTFGAASAAYRLFSASMKMGGTVPALFGTSKYASVAEGKRSGLIYSFKPRADCILIGRTAGFMGWLWRYVCLPGIEHVILYAKTGSGKGVSYVITNCLNYIHSLVVLDLKCTAWKTTAAHRADTLGQDVFLFSPLAEDGRTHCWNPLGDIDDSQTDYISKLQRRAYNLFPETEGKDKFWQDGARTAFFGISVLVCETPELALNPSTVFGFFTRGDGTETLIRMIEGRRAAGRPYSQTGVNLLSDYLNGTPEVVKGVRKHVTTVMSIWFNPKVAAATARNDFSLRCLRRKRMTVYVGVMPSDLEQLGGLLRLFFLQLFEANTDSLPEHDDTITHPAHVLLDEMTALPVMRSIAKAAGFAREFGLQFSFVVQSKNQIKELYRDNGAASLLENVGAEIVFGTDDLNLCKEVSERAGYDTVDNVSRSMPRFFSMFRAGEQNENTSKTKRALILPQEVARMPKDKEMVFRTSVEPFYLSRLQWYTDRNFMHLATSPLDPPKIFLNITKDDGSVNFRHLLSDTDNAQSSSQSPQ